MATPSLVLRISSSERRVKKDCPPRVQSFARGRMAAALCLGLVFLLPANQLLWGKRAPNATRHPNAELSALAQSKLSPVFLPGTAPSFVQAGTLNQTLQEGFRHSPAVLNFEQKYNGSWQVLVDERSMAPAMLMGGGLPFSQHSADASKAGPTMQAKLAARDTLEEFAAAAQQFLIDNREFLKVNPSALQLDRAVSGVLDASTGKHRLVFQNTYNGVPILGSAVTLFISHGNLILYGAERIANFQLATQPSLSPRDAVAKMDQSLGLSAGDVALDHAAELFITLEDSPASKAARARPIQASGFDAARYDGPPGQGYAPRLVYRIQFHVAGDPRSLVALVDANTGERTDLFDQNRYQGQNGIARGSIYTRGSVSTPGYVNQGGTQAPEYLVPLDILTLTNSGTTVFTNPGGMFNFNSLNPTGFSTALAGFQCKANESTATACAAPQGSADSVGNISFMPFVDDGHCATSPSSPSPGNGQATHAAMNGWFHTNFAISHARKFLSPLLDTFFNSPMNLIVNDNGCSSFWTSFCPQLGGECIDMYTCSVSDEENNLADEPDTMSHEYGHALDYHTKANGLTGDTGKGEGLADIDAWLNTHRTCLSPGDLFGSNAPPFGGSASFFPGVPVGDLCNIDSIPLEPQGLWQTGDRDYGVFICHDNGSGACPPGTPGRLESNDAATACANPAPSFPDCQAPAFLGYECHCESHTSSGSVVDLFKLLVNRYGTNQAWYMTERFYYLGLPGITNAYGSSGAGSTYANFLAVDDDDGNISNGTPNADLIFQAFRAHGTEGTQVPRFQANCTTSPGGSSPAAPTGFTATAQAGGGILLQWNAVPGASGYRLYRTAASQPGHNYETDPIPSSFYGPNGVFFKLIKPSTRGANPNSGTNLFPASGGGTQSYLDSEVAPGYEYFYQIQTETPFGNGQGCLSSLSPGNVDLVANATVVGFTQETLPVRFGGAATSSTIGNTGAVQAGYGIVTLNSGSAPYGTAVFSLSQNGVVVSEVGVPSSPPTSDAQIFVDFQTNVAGKTNQNVSSSLTIDTGIAVVNRNNNVASVTYTLRGFDATLLAQGHGTVAANAHFAKFIDQLIDVAPDFNLPPNFSTATQFATLEISSSLPLSVLGLRQTTNQRSETLFTSTPIVDLTQTPSGTNVYFPQVADGGGYKMTIILINTTGAPQTGSLRFSKDDGSPLTVNQVGGSTGSSFAYNIPAGGFFVFQTDGSPSQVNAGSAQAVPNPPLTSPVGAGIFSFTQNGILVTESGIPAATPTTHARIYVDRSGGHDTGLAIVNPGGSSLSVTLTALQWDGSTSFGNGNVFLNPNGHAAKFASEFISGLPIGFTGVLDIASSSPFAALTLRALTNGRGDFLLTTFPIADFNQPAPTPIVFPQIADGGGFKTQFILLGTSGASTVTLNFYGDTGASIPVGAKSDR